MKMNSLDRDWYLDGNEGNRRLRMFVDPNLGKSATNELGFAGAFGNDLNHSCMLLICLGFAAATTSITQCICLDLSSHEKESLMATYVLGTFGTCLGPWMGSINA